MGQRITQVDAFTDRAFAGNPAAICVLDAPASDRWMQQVAREMNISETAFLLALRDADGFNLRWFTPTVEVDLCGHATLAAAHVLWEEGHLERGKPARFQTRSGWLSAQRRGEDITLDFPTLPVHATPAPPELAPALNAPFAFTGRNELDLLVEFESEQVLAGIAPDFGLLAKIPVRGVIATSRSDDPQFDFASRFFAPRVGVPEDPVCGSAHCALGPYWTAKLGKTELVGHQISDRGGVVRVRVDGAKTELGGRAVTVLRGELLTGPC